MYGENNFEYFTRKLTFNNKEDRGWGVGHLTAIDMIGDERLIPLLEPLLKDESITITGDMPPIYCEVR